MASMKLEDLELCRELNEHELEVIQGGDDKSGSRKNKRHVTGINTKGWSKESLRRLHCALTSELWHFC